MTEPTVRADVSGGQVQGIVGAGSVVIKKLTIDNRRTSETQADAFSALHQLPADVADFAGRAAQVEALLGVLSAPGGRVAISAIDGMGGLGKTTLAVHVAHRLAGRYPDGQIVVDMAGTSTAPLAPAQGLARVIRAFEPLMQLPEAVTELRPIYLSVLHGRRVLVILDNAVDGDQVAPLVPPADCALIVTARRRIAVAGVVRVDLDLLAPRRPPACCARLSATAGPIRRNARASRNFAVSCHWRCVSQACSWLRARIGRRPSSSSPSRTSAKGSACCNWREARRSMLPPRWR